MTVKELKEELSFYDDDVEIIFEVDDEFEPESITEDKWGYTTVHINNRIEPWFMSIRNENMFINFEKKV